MTSKSHRGSDAKRVRTVDNVHSVNLSSGLSMANGEG